MARDIREFDPKALAAIDADMWVAYYNHRFFRLFVLLLKLNYPHFRPNPAHTLQGAYHSAMAAIVFRRTKGHEDRDTTLKHLERFYELMAAHSVQSFDYKNAAELELKWWLVDRYPERYTTSRATALAEGMAVIYNMPATKLEEYGKKRAAAMELLGTYHHDTKAFVDWDMLRKLLSEAYTGLHQAVWAD